MLVLCPCVFNVALSSRSELIGKSNLVSYRYRLRKLREVSDMHVLPCSSDEIIGLNAMP